VTVGGLNPIQGGQEGRGGEPLLFVGSKKRVQETNWDKRCGKVKEGPDGDPHAAGSSRLQEKGDPDPKEQRKWGA